jgi:hypothetical protein
MWDIPIYRDEDRQRYVGYYFEQLARHCLHRPARSLEAWESDRGYGAHFDIDDVGLNASFDVKGANNQDSKLKLFDDQLTAQIDGLELPLDTAFLWIFSYRGCRWEDGRMVRTLKNESGALLSDLAAFLAKNVLDVYVVGLRLIDLMREANGVRFYNRDKLRERYTLCITRSAFKDTERNARNVLGTLGVSDVSRWLPPRAMRFRPRIVETRFGGNQVSFRLHLLVPNGFKNRFLRRLNGNVKRVEDS